MIVRVAQLGNPNRDHVELPEGGTVQEALNKANVTTTGITVTINGAPAAMDSVLRHKQTIMVASKVAGGVA